MSFQIGDDVIDSRDIIERFEEMDEEYTDLKDDANYSDESNEEECHAAVQTWEDEEGEEFANLTAICGEGEGYASDWTHGAALINEDYFNQYMDEMLEDIGGIPKDAPDYVTIVVDYDMLKQDYHEFDVDGETYLVRM